jgi:hypothetical protein
MSEIPFVNQLGDELERAAERALLRPDRRRRRRRLGLFAVAGALLVSGSALAAGLLSGDVAKQATNAVACYDGAGQDFSRSVAVVPPEAGSASASPVELCRRELALANQPERALVACGTQGSVAVIPGQRPSDCTAAGFAPLDGAYGAARERVAGLERQILALERSSDCIAPAELARRVQRLLDRSGWTGWTASVNGGLGDGPCGSVSTLGGDGRRYLAGSLDADGRRIFVFRGAPRRTTDLLYSAQRSLLAPLFAESGATCFSFGELAERARDVFAANGLTVRVTRGSVPRGTALDDEDGRWSRYQAGCAVLAGGEPGDDPHSVVLEFFVKE